MSLGIAKEELKALKNSSFFLESYDSFVIALRKSGLVSFLRGFARPYITDGGNNVNVAASQAAFCDGYNKCLDDLLYFRELYLDKVETNKQLKPTFGALGLAFSKGDLTKEELDKYGK